MTKPSADPRIAKWRRWIDGTIKSNVLTMHLHRHVWQVMTKIVEEHGALPDSYWWEFQFDIYATTQASAVRRQADTHQGAASLAKLIEEIRDDTGRITRDHWLGLWTGPDTRMRGVAERGWQNQFADGSGLHLDPAIPAADLDEIRAASAQVKHHVDKHIAHADARAVSANITLKLTEVYDAIDVIGRAYMRYFNLLTGNVMGRLVPAIQGDWEAVFREPWIRPEWGQPQATSVERQASPPMS